MPSLHPYIYWLDQIHSSHSYQVGDQAIHQSLLAQSGISDTKGFVVSFEAFDSLLAVNDLIDVFKDKIKTLNLLNQSQLQLFSQYAAAKLQNADLPDDVGAQIAKAYSQYKSTPPVLLTPSTPPKTLPDSVYMQLQMHPVVTSGDANIIEQIRKLWSLLFHPDAVLYRHKHHNFALPQMAVVVRTIEFPEVSGELFTSDPVTGDRSMSIIEAVWGLSTNLLTGQINPDHYRIAKQPREVIHQETISQHLKTIFQNHAVSVTKVASKQQNQPKLSQTELNTLTSLGESFQRYFMSPQHLTWWKHGSRFYVIDSQRLDLTMPTKVEATENPGLNNLKLILRGNPASRGIISGKVIVIEDLKQLDKVKIGDIIVTESLSTQLIPAINKAAGIITELGGQTSHAAIISREAGTPCIVGANRAVQILKHHQIVTINATTGEIFAGGLPVKQTLVKLQKKTVDISTTATKLYISVESFVDVSKTGKSSSDGAFIAPLAAAAEYFKYKTIDQLKLKDFLEAQLDQLFLSFGSRPVFFELDNHAKDPSQNSRLGFNGALCLSNQPKLLDLELSLIKRLKSNHPNLNLVIPLVRSTIELETLKKYLSGAGVLRSSLCKLWITLGTPAGLFQVRDYHKQGIDGIVVDINQLAALSLGLDPDNENTKPFFYPFHPVVTNNLRSLAQASASLGIQVIVKCNHIYGNLLSDLTREGVHGFWIPTSTIDNCRQEIYQTELDMVTHIKH